MISHKHKCIYIHIPKACGNSVEYVLGGFTFKDASIWDNKTHRRNDSTKNFYFDKQQRHWSWRRYYSRFPKEFQEYFKFTVVRNPFDSLVSQLVWGQQGNNPIYSPHWNLKDIIWRYPTLFFHLSPSWYIFSVKGCLMVDFIIRYENLAKDWLFVAEKLNLSKFLPIFNKSERGPYQDFYTPTLRKIAEWGFSRDKKRLGYSFRDDPGG
jgi:chondroitin 4-sulfotransferase 11